VAPTLVEAERAPSSAPKVIGRGRRQPAGSTPSSAPREIDGGAGHPSPYLRRQPVKNFLLVRERDRRRYRELRLLAFAVVPAALALLAYTWVQTEIVRTGYQVRALERRLEEMARTERQLRLEASRLESLERVEEAAADELGMTFPTLEQMVFVDAP